MSEGLTSRQPVTGVSAPPPWALSSTAAHTAATIVAIAMALVAMSNVSCRDSDGIRSPDLRLQEMDPALDWTALGVHQCFTNVTQYILFQ